MKKHIYFIDLSHESKLGLGSDHMPLQLGLIAAYLLKVHPDKVEVQLFKFVKDLEEAVRRQPPFIVAASNYMWNIDLEYKFASAIKTKYPETILVFGGPNYPDELGEQVMWLNRYPNIDFYVYKDGEIPFADLVGALLTQGVAETKKAKLPSCHALIEGVPFFGALAPRLTDLTVIPSPYTTGLMDKFFSDNLVPSMQTNRGCPFTCTFCVEGKRYYNKVFRTSHERKVAEVEYIVARVTKTRTLRVVDSNFGMFAEDEDFCRFLGEIQKRTGYPDFISCSTGKNQKERILRCASFLGGAMRLTASVQSLDSHVLEIIKRTNISFEALMEMSDKVSEGAGHAYSEIILGLPGDSLAAERCSFKGLMEAGINNITQHQLALLHGTEAASPESRREFALRSMFRPIQRCVGRYQFDGKEFAAVDVEEICVASNSLSFDDYLEARRLYLTVGLFYNDRIFGEINALLRLLHLSAWEWICLVHQDIANASPAVQALYDGYIGDTKAELWANEEDLVRDVTASIERFVEGEAGGNVIYKYRSRSIVECFKELHEVAFRNLRRYLTEKGISCDDIVIDLERFSLCSKGDIFNLTLVREESFGYDILRLIQDPALARSGGTLDDVHHPTRFRFLHTDQQRKDIEMRRAFYGEGIPGLTMLMSRYPVKRFYRRAEIVEN